MNSHAGTAADSMMPSVNQWIAWPAACYSFWWTLQLEWLSELAKPTLTLPPWMAWYNGAEQLA
jgi:hypothetical protein